MYVPNATLNAVHNRASWVLFPSAFQEIGYESTLICARFLGQRPPGIQVVETALPALDPENIGWIRSLFEPITAFREVYRRKPRLVLIGPFRSSLATFLPLVLHHRLLSTLFGFPRTKFMLKADWSLDTTDLRTWEAVIAKALLSLSTFVLDLVSFETYCGIELAKELPLIRARKLVPRTRWDHLKTHPSRARTRLTCGGPLYCAWRELRARKG